MATGPTLLGDALRKRGLTLRQAADEAGISDHTKLHRWLHGRSAPSVADAIRLRDAFRVPIESWAA